jgi:hypothetical protein
MVSIKMQRSSPTKYLSASIQNFQIQELKSYKMQLLLVKSTVKELN